jgi:hypothetical protein
MTGGYFANLLGSVSPTAAPATILTNTDALMHERYRTESVCGHLFGGIPMDQLSDLIDELRRDNDCIAAAKADVSDRAQDRREAEAKLAKAEQGLAACEARAEITKRRIDRVIEARAHSGYDDEPLMLEGP